MTSRSDESLRARALFLRDDSCRLSAHALRPKINLCGLLAVGLLGHNRLSAVRLPLSRPMRELDLCGSFLDVSVAKYSCTVVN